MDVTQERIDELILREEILRRIVSHPDAVLVWELDGNGTVTKEPLVSVVRIELPVRCYDLHQREWESLMLLLGYTKIDGGWTWRSP